MTALENVMTAADAKNKVGLIGSMFGIGTSKADESRSHAKAAELLNFMGISHRAGQLAKNLPYGDQRRLEIARALALEPRVLLLDEPAAGLDLGGREDILERISRYLDEEGAPASVIVTHHIRDSTGYDTRTSS